MRARTGLADLFAAGFSDSATIALSFVGRGVGGGSPRALGWAPNTLAEAVAPPRRGFRYVETVIDGLELPFSAS